jgi:hypothetical protein
VPPPWWIVALFVRTLDLQRLQRAVAMRHVRCTLKRIAWLLALRLSNIDGTL